MKQLVVLLTLVATPLPAMAQQDELPPLSLDQRMLVRCSAAFALVSHGQGVGNADALRYPDMSERGREFFVRASAQVMDEANLDRSQIERLLSREAQALLDEGAVDAAMSACLPLLPPE